MPHLYADAANVLKLSQQSKGSLKSLVFNRSQSLKKSKALFALVCETLKYRKVINELIKRTNLLTELKFFHKNEWLLRVCIFEHVFGKGLRGKYKNLLKHYQVRLHSELARYKVQHKITDNIQLAEGENSKSVTIPRYVRINTLKASVSDVIARLSSDYSYIEVRQCSFSDFITATKALGRDQFMRDAHIAELLVFGAESELHTHELYKNGSIILQDKASCFPGYVLSSLNVDHHSHVIDSCAAPGNKTSHAAAVLNNKGKIYAFDKDVQRIETMKKLLEKAGATCVQVENKDFLKVNASEERYSAVTHVIVDPSCTGSGIVSRLSHLTDNQASSDVHERVERLSAFQEKILTHAMSFPAVKFVVYSTCSIHEGENEQVVMRALENCPTYEVHHILPNYPNRGHESFGDIGRYCIRLNPENDCTNGFFVAALKKKSQQLEFSKQTDTNNVCDTKDRVKVKTDMKAGQTETKSESNTKKYINARNVIENCQVSSKRKGEKLTDKIDCKVNKTVMKKSKKKNEYKTQCDDTQSVLNGHSTNKSNENVEIDTTASAKQNCLKTRNTEHSNVQNDTGISIVGETVELTSPVWNSRLNSTKKQKRKKRKSKPVTAQ